MSRKKMVKIGQTNVTEILYREGSTRAEIAKKLKVSQGAVKDWINRGQMPLEVFRKLELNKKPVGVRLSRGTLSTLDKLEIQTGFNRTQLIEFAVDRFVDNPTPKMYEVGELE